MKITFKHVYDSNVQNHILWYIFFKLNKKAYCISRTGLDWTCKTWTSKTRTCKTWTSKTRTCKTRTSKTRTCKTRTQDKLLRTSFFFQIFSVFVNRIKLNGEQTFTKTNLRLKTLFIYFQAVSFRRFSERNNPCLTFQLQKGFICASYKQFKKFWPRRNLFITSS